MIQPINMFYRFSYHDWFGDEHVTYVGPMRVSPGIRAGNSENEVLSFYRVS